jgi:hypothetical protein
MFDLSCFFLKKFNFFLGSRCDYLFASLHLKALCQLIKSIFGATRRLSGRNSGWVCRGRCMPQSGPVPVAAAVVRNNNFLTLKKLFAASILSRRGLYAVGLRKGEQFFTNDFLVERFDHIILNAQFYRFEDGFLLIIHGEYDEWNFG